MSKIKFILNVDQTDVKGLSPIYVRAEINKHRYVHYIGEKVKARHWNTTTQEVDAPKKGELPNGHEEINQIIDWYKDKWKDLTKHRKKKDITAEMVNDLLERREVKKVEIGGPDFFTKFEEYLKTTAASQSWRPNTVKNKTNILNALKKWDQETGFGAGFGKINKGMVTSIKTWSNQVKKYAPSHLNKIMSTIHAFLADCVENEYYDGKNMPLFTSETKEVTHVSLTKNEFFTLLDYPFTREALKVSRDVYCFAVLTGQRIGDVMDMRREDIVNNVWMLVPQKSHDGKPIEIPVISMAQEIIDRYHHPVFVMPRKCLEGKSGIRKMVKEACRAAGIDSEIVVTTFPGGTPVKTTYKKYEKIILHTGRKSYATIGLNNGISPTILRSVTGHTKDAVFDKYGKVNVDAKREAMEKIFKRPGQTGNKLEYKGYFGTVDFDAANRVFTGQMEGTIQRITFCGSGVDELEAAFREKVDRYIEDQAKQNDN